MPFSKDFLIEIAREYELKDSQIEVFMLIFGEGKSRLQIEKDHNISTSTTGTRLTEVYSKFGFTGMRPNKIPELSAFLQDRYKLYCRSKPKPEIVINDIDVLVHEVRSRLLPFITDPSKTIGTMKILSQRVPVDKIYIYLNVLERISCEVYVPQWEQDFIPSNPTDFDRYGLGRVQQKRLEALTAVRANPKLMVVGKPGAGKTTLLKSLAVECISKNLFNDLVPIFVTLRDFAENAKKDQSWKLADYLVDLLAEEWEKCDRASAEKILSEGRALVLLDIAILNELRTR